MHAYKRNMEGPAGGRNKAARRRVFLGERRGVRILVEGVGSPLIFRCCAPKCRSLYMWQTTLLQVYIVWTPHLGKSGGKVVGDLHSKMVLLLGLHGSQGGILRESTPKY